MQARSVSPQWAQVASDDAPQVAAALSVLLSSRQGPSNTQQARALVEALRQHGSSPAVATPALLLLARWAPLQNYGPQVEGLPPRAAGAKPWQASTVVEEAVELAGGIASGVGLQQDPGPAAARFLGSAAAGKLHIADVMSEALVGLAGSPSPNLPKPDVLGGIASLVPALLGEPETALWVVAALLTACQAGVSAAATSQQPGPGATTATAQGHLQAAATLTSLAPLYPAMRALTTVALGRAPPAALAAALLQPLVGLLAGAVGEVSAAVAILAGAAPCRQSYTGTGTGSQPSALCPGQSDSLPLASLKQRQLSAGAQQVEPPAAAVLAALCCAAPAVLCLGGLLEGVLRAAPGFEACRALAAEVETLLHQACQTALAACEISATMRTGNSSAGSEGPAIGGRHAAEELGMAPHMAGRLLRDCCSLATAQALQGCGRPVPAAASVQCQAATLLQSALSLEPFLELAAQQASPGEANALLELQLASAPMQHAAELAGALARGASASRLLAKQQWLVGAFAAAAAEACRGYSRYVTGMPDEWMQQVSAPALKALLDRLFLSSIVVLTSVWAAVKQADPTAAQGSAGASGPQQAEHTSSIARTVPRQPFRDQQQPELQGRGAEGGAKGSAAPAPAHAPAVAAALLGVFADLQFCRVALPAYAVLLKDTLAAATSDGAAADALVARLPCYTELSAACNAQQDMPAWLADPVLAAKVQFLMSALAPCCHLLPQPLLEERLAPLALLYLLHPHAPTSAAAHQLFAALLLPLPPAHHERLAPFYIDRALEGCSPGGATALDPLRAGLASMLQGLPAASPVGLYCMSRLLDKCGELEAAGSRESWQLLKELFGMAAGLLLSVDRALLEPAMSLLGGYVETPCEEKDAGGWEHCGGLQGMAAALHTSIHDGIDATAAGDTSVQHRQDVYGANRFKEVPAKSFLSLWFSQLSDATLIMLMVAALVSTVLGAAVPSEREQQAYTEGIAIWVAVLVVSLVGAGNDWHKDRQFRKLNQQKETIEVKVVRNGKEQLVVVGDLLVLDTGDKVVADGYVIEAHGLVIDEASLTGEADPVKKTADKDPWCRSGTQVTEGSGSMMVLAVGEHSDWGRTMSLVMGEPEDTPLQEKLGWLATAIGKVGLVVAVVSFVVLMIREIAVIVTPSMLKWCVIDQQVVAVPEGLPLAVTISLAYSMQKMMKDNNFVRVLAACETMGGATAICSDKTGTLTENRMTVVEGYFCATKYPSVPQPAQLPADARQEIILNCALNSKAFLVEGEKGSVEFVGNRTECALLVMIQKWGEDYKAVRDLYHDKIAEVYGFSSERKMASVLVRNGSGYRLYVKGASEMVLSRATAMVDSAGQTVPMSDKLREELNVIITEMASRGLRTLGLSYTDFPLVDPNRPDDYFAKPPEDNLTLLCVVGIKDPVRAEVPDAVATCQRAGIVVRMVTGDNIHTAKHIARECGILTDEGIALEGPVFRRMPEEELLPLLPKLQVLARSSPQDKHTLVCLLKKQGEVVAVTGDGTNDAPALKESDVGLAMGIAGTEVAKEAADIVIMDDNFSSIVKSVLWGRSVFTNIRKFLQFQLTINAVALIVAFVAAVANGETPLNVLQLLWVNLIMDSLAALALATEDPTPDLLNHKPHGRDEPLISRIMWKHIITQGCYQIFWIFLIFYGMPAQFEAFKLPNKCSWSLYAGETPVCVLYTGGDCDINDPSSDAFCSAGQDDCPRLDTVNDAYDTASDDWKDTEKDAMKKTNSMVFNTFIWLQMFNMFNARKMRDEYNVFEGIFKAPIFLTIWVLIVAFQIILMFFLGGIFKVERQSWAEWVCAIAIGVGSLPLAFFTKVVTR
ncbi:hypothetical protein N2152v2_003730 [Parachlorella kessleri]